MVMSGPLPVLGSSFAADELWTNPGALLDAFLDEAPTLARARRGDVILASSQSPKDMAMLDDLLVTIKKLKDRINDHAVYFREGMPEARTRSALIDPVLSALKWDVTDPALVQIEPKTKTKRPDYALLDSKGNPVLFVEAKSLADRKPAMGQAISYVYEENRPCRFYKTIVSSAYRQCSLSRKHREIGHFLLIRQIHPRTFEHVAQAHL